jgi:ribonuclease HI
VRGRAICDGRGNAGTGARAVVLELEDGRVYERAEKLEPCTNIVAEHLAIQLSVEMAIEYGVTDLVILNDSQTPVRHVDGSYKVKAEHLKPIVEKTWRFGGLLKSVSIKWVPREQTKRPDKLCREVDS